MGFKIEKFQDESGVILYKVLYKDTVLYADVVPIEIFESDLAEQLNEWEKFVEGADGAIQVLRDDVIVVYFLKSVFEDDYKKVYRYFSGAVDTGFIVYNKEDQNFYISDHEGNILSEALKVIHIYK